jgi:hypothetical protein
MISGASGGRENENS